MAKRKSKKYIFFAALIAALIVTLLSVFFPKNELISELPLRVSFIDVGQGDCSLIQCDGYVILIDGGEAEQVKKVEKYLLASGVRQIDGYILTHPHFDHIGAAADIISDYKVDTVYMTDFDDYNMPVTNCFENVLNAIDKKNCEIVTVKKGDKFNFGDLKINILSPSSQTDDYNDMSIVFRAEYKSVSFLFTGDASSLIEDQLIDSGEHLKSDVLKVGHHGSAHSSSAGFLDKVQPDYAVISCGKGNSYGHPSSSTTERLGNYVIKQFRTDRNGTVIFYSDGHRLFPEV